MGSSKRQATNSTAEKKYDKVVTFYLSTETTENARKLHFATWDPFCFSRFFPSMSQAQRNENENIMKKRLNFSTEKVELEKN